MRLVSLLQSQRRSSYYGRCCESLRQIRMQMHELRHGGIISVHPNVVYAMRDSWLACRHVRAAYNQAGQARRPDQFSSPAAVAGAAWMDKRNISSVGRPLYVLVGSKGCCCAVVRKTSYHVLASCRMVTLETTVPGSEDAIVVMKLDSPKGRRMAHVHMRPRAENHVEAKPLGLVCRVAGHVPTWKRSRW